MAGDRDQLVLRPLRAEDAPAVVRVWHESKQAAYPYLPTEQGRTLAEDDEIFRRYILPRTAIWVALVDGAIAGFLAMRGSYVDRLYIHPDRQRRGIGGTLHDAILENLDSPTALLSTQVDNERARALYRGRGWRVVVEQLRFTPGGTPFCVMARDLP